jgi:HSP20 family protein
MRDLIPFFSDRAALNRSLGDQMDKLFNEIFSKDFFPGALAKGSYPKMNVYDEKDTLCVDAYVPELPKDKIHIEVKDRVMTMRGDSNQDKEVSSDKYYCREVSKRSFSRSIRLPDDVDDSKVSAELKDGMLRVRIPYKEKKDSDNTKSIEIT